MYNLELNSRVLVTGGTGFVGKSLYKNLLKNGYENVIPIGKKDFDLLNHEDCEYMIRTINPDIIVHLAATVGGIGANQKEPGRFIYENLIMGTNLLELSRVYEVKKFVHVSTVCSYPKIIPVPFKEDDIHNGLPEITNSPYGIAKKTIGTMLQAYNKQYGLNGIYLIPTNMYGPNDNFDPDSSHVIPAIIKKVYNAKLNNESSISCWGTGQVSRDFLYVHDFSDAIIKAMSKVNHPIEINIGSGKEIYINDLTNIICKLMDYHGEVVWDKSKPDGQPRRCLDTSRAELLLDWKANTSFEDGLKETIEWYKNKLNG